MTTAYDRHKKSQLKWLNKNGYSSPAEYISIRRKNTRQQVIDALGGKCVQCGFDDIRALQVDHVHGDGYKDRKIKGHTNFYRDMLKEILDGSDRYQLLCANCNWIKRYENSEHGKGNRGPTKHLNMYGVDE